MEKLNRVTLLDMTQRPKAPRMERLTPEQRSRGQRLAWFHNYHRAQLDDVAKALASLDAAEVADTVSNLQMAVSYRRFGNLCGQECEMLSAHHGIEDAYVFPVLHQEGGDALKKVVERLMAEHLVVHELIEELETKAGILVTAPSAEAFASAGRTFEELQICVRSHFGYEETELEDDLAPNFYPALSSLRRLIMPCWAGCAMAFGA